MGRPDAELYRGVRLTRALEWRSGRRPTSTPPSASSSSPAGGMPRSADAACRRRAVTTVAAAWQDRDARRDRARQPAADHEAARANDAAERANDEAERAGDEARAPTRRPIVPAQALAASAISALDEDLSLAKLLAVTSATTAEPTAETTAALHRAGGRPGHGLSRRRL